MRHGGQILIDQLKLHGTDRVFCVPGESYLAALDGLFESGIDTVVCRQEGGTAIMAEAHGVLTGQPGIAFVTRGPGATNAAAGVHVAFQDSTPMILFIGQVASDQRDREAFQEVDYRQMFGPLAKWVAQIDSTERIPEYVSRAFHVACSGRPGPVVLALPEDMLSAVAEAADGKRYMAPLASASDEQVDQVLARLAKAERPLLVVGGGSWSAAATEAAQAFASLANVPVATSFRCQDYFDNRHANYAGDMGIGKNPALNTAIEQADVLLVVGARLGEMTSNGYSLLDIPVPKQSLIHVFANADEIGRVYRADLGVVSHPEAFFKSLLSRFKQANRAHATLSKQANASYKAWIQPIETPGPVQIEQVVKHLNDVLPDDATVTNGAGNFAAWVHRYFQYRQYGNQLAPTSGSMGYGLPASVAAKLAFPERTVVNVSGDGDFQMHMQEFGTAVQYGANIIVIICNNGIYGTIRMHQERTYPGRVSGTNMINPDFAKLAESYGGHGEHVTETGQFAAAFERALASNKPAIIELKIDPEAIAPSVRLSSLGKA